MKVILKTIPLPKDRDDFSRIFILLKKSFTLRFLFGYINDIVCARKVQYVYARATQHTLRQLPYAFYIFSYIAH